MTGAGEILLGRTIPHSLRTRDRHEREGELSEIFKRHIYMLQCYDAMML